jgi:hypothetical protein
MDDSTKVTVDKFRAKLAGLEAQCKKIKVAINGIYELEGETIPYPEVDSEAENAASPQTIRPDQFFGRPLATVVREILNSRSERQLGAISLEDLFAVMLQGGFQFEGKDEATKRRALAITVGKNPAFVRLPNSGHIGLADWYPSAKRGKRNGDEEKPDTTENLPLEGQTNGSVENGSVEKNPEPNSGV